MTRWMASITMAIAFGGVANADTIVFKSGVQIEGKVLFQDENTVRVDIGGRERTYPAAEVATVEENDKTGHFDPAKAIEEAHAQVAKLDRETGLTAAQRREVKDLLSKLQSTDEHVHDDAKRALVAFHEHTASLLQFFEWWLPGLSPRFVPGVLEILGVIHPDRAAQIAPGHLTDWDARSRAMAVTVLSMSPNQDQMTLIGRGMVDPAYEVRIAAAKAIGQHKLKEATPLLLDNFDTGDPHLAAVVRNSLREVWSTEARQVTFETKAEWEEHWAKRSADVGEPMLAMALQPFVEPGQVFEDE